MPDHRKVKEHNHLRIFGALLHADGLWHLNRRSISGAFAVGLFMAWVPLPFQMVIAAAAAIFFSVNLPVSVGLVWISNPLTMPPLFMFAYWVGASVLGSPPLTVEFDLTMEWLQSILPQIWEPLLLGCLINGVISALLGYFGMRTFWIWHVRRRWNHRVTLRKNSLQKNSTQ